MMFSHLLQLLKTKKLKMSFHGKQIGSKVVLLQLKAFRIRDATLGVGKSRKGFHSKPLGCKLPSRIELIYTKLA